MLAYKVSIRVDKHKNYSRKNYSFTFNLLLMCNCIDFIYFFRFVRHFERFDSYEG